ncbi:mucin-2-like [Danio rerio]|uniref:Mucin-2-like n=1 Tax=Danio rerio TaxID=7955 RepID=A0AC58IYL1_DANRE
MCGNRTGIFQVITENIPCGRTGTTCSKSVFIQFGRVSLHLSDELETQYLMESGALIRKIGMYLVIDTNIGLTVLWDRKTTIHIILQPEYMGEVCGLCGNFNGDGKDDFTTKGGVQTSNVIEFVDSWKQKTSCPDAAPDFDPCVKNLYREEWAVLKCSIITSDTFKDCQKKVDPTPYYDNCLKDTCACDTGGDCECLCTAVAAYAQACNEADVCVNWRTPDFCPVYCDYYNKPDECTWHYSPCHPPCYKTCLNPSGICNNTLPNLEGCFLTCPDDKPFYDDENQSTSYI